MAFTQKRINVSFSMGTGSIEQDNTGTLSSGPPTGSGPGATHGGLRIASQIVIAGGQAPGQLECAIYGMTLAEMNQLATVGTQIGLQGKNEITLDAGDDQSGMSNVFKGTITMAFFDGQGMPEVCFRVQAFGGMLEKVQPQNPVSVDGSGDVKTMLSTIAKTLNFKFEPNKIDGVKLMNHYEGGSGLDQFMRICGAAGLEWALDKGILAVWKPGGARQQSPQATPSLSSSSNGSSSGGYLIAPETGMIGYPAFTQNQVIVKQLWRPGLSIGDSVTIKSQITPANGNWKVNRIDYELDANIPNGRWFQTVIVSNIDPGGDPPPGSTTS